MNGNSPTMTWQTYIVLVAPVLAGLAVAIGVPILLFYVYGVVPVSLCRAGCGVSTTKDGFKFDFEEEYSGTRNPDAASVDAVSRIGATSIGEVSLSVASGHLGVSGQNPSIGVVSSSTRESTTALAGSITGHRLEVQADVSTSETASAVTCVSEKSGNTLNDTASTRALAGSILSSRQHIDSANVSEDGISERVRFDNTVCYVIDGKKESDIWYTGPLDQDLGADKLSVDSGRSMRSSERSFRDELDSSSLSSGHKRMTFSQRKLTNSQHRNLSVDSNTGSNNYIPENVSLEVEEEDEEQEEHNGGISVTLHGDEGASSSSAAAAEKAQEAGAASSKAEKSNVKRSATKTAILRNLFFFQNENGGPKS
ncbi:metal ion binding [Sergentomyia squamirostris]